RVTKCEEPLPSTSFEMPNSGSNSQLRSAGVGAHPALKPLSRLARGIPAARHRNPKVRSPHRPLPSAGSSRDEAHRHHECVRLADDSLASGSVFFHGFATSAPGVRIAVAANALLNVVVLGANA